MKNNKLLKSALKEKDLKSYLKLEKDCKKEEDVEVSTGDIVLTQEELNQLVGQIEEAVLEENALGFDTIGAELEKHMYTSRTLYLNDEVSAESVDHVVMLIHKWNLEDYGLDVDSRKDITLYIDTNGGDLMKATTLVSAIENSITPITGIVEGIAMSAGLWIFLSTHYRIATRHADFMYHTLRANSDISSLQEIQNTSRYYERLQNKIDKYIVEETNITMEMLQEKKDKNLDWFIDGEELLNLGIVHELL